MASMIKYLVLEVDNQEIMDANRFVMETIPRTPHLQALYGKHFTYDIHIQPLEMVKSVGAKLHFVEVVIHGFDYVQPDPYVVVYRESVITSKEESEFLLRRISRIMLRLVKLSGFDFVTLSATRFWNVMYLCGQMEKFDHEFRALSKLGTIK